MKVITADNIQVFINRIRNWVGRAFEFSVIAGELKYIYAKAPVFEDSTNDPDYKYQTGLEVQNSITVDISATTAQPTNEIYNGKKVYCKRMVFNVTPSSNLAINVNEDNLQELWVDYGNSWIIMVSDEAPYPLTVHRSGIATMASNSSTDSRGFQVGVICPVSSSDVPQVTAYNNTGDEQQASILIKFTYKT